VSEGWGAACPAWMPAIFFLHLNFLIYQLLLSRRPKYLRRNREAEVLRACSPSIPCLSNGPGINHVCMLPPFLKSVIKCPSHRPKVPAGPDLQCRSTRHRAKTAEAARIRDVGISPTTARVLTILAASSGQSNGRPGSGSQLPPGLFDSNRAEYRQTALLIATVDVSRLNICIYANCQCGQQDKFHLRLQ
jgi:hypothetical protein